MGMFGWIGPLSFSAGGAAVVMLLIRVVPQRMVDFWFGRLLEATKAEHAQALEKLRATYSFELESHKIALMQAQQLVQMQSEHSVFVTRAQFETEFDALKHVFESLSQVRLGISGLRPSFEIAPVGDTEALKRDRLLGRLDSLTKSYNSLLSVSQNLMPFYSKEIYKAIETCLRATSVEISQVRTANEQTFRGEWYEQGRMNCSDFMNSYGRIADLIRSRIESLSILR